MMVAMTNLFPDLLTQFLLSLSLGTAAFSWIASPKLTGAGFMRLVTGHGVIFLSLMIGLSWALFGAPYPLWLAFEGIALLSLILQWKLHRDRRTKSMWALFLLQTVFTIVLFLAFAGKGPAQFAFLLSSALLLGVTHYSMLLGHYYLVVPKLTERPLLICLKMFWTILFGKLLFSAFYTWQAWPYLSEGSVLGDGFIFNWLVISMRWLWGYGALLVLSYFAWRLCRMRSIQSATGVLYIMVFFVFIGELLSAYLYFKHGLAI
jgi:hypothetical protein